MRKKNIDVQTIKEAEKKVPEGFVKFSKDKTFNKLNKIFPGDNFSSVRDSLKSTGVARYEDAIISADFDSKGNVMAMAAAVPRKPVKSEDYLLRSVPDFDSFGTISNANFDTRRTRIGLYRQIADREGIVNNAIKKTASLVSQDGSFKIRSAKQGKRPQKSVNQDLLSLLTFWQENVNSSGMTDSITGSRGIKQIIRRESRQAMIEGDSFLRQVWEEVTIPTMGGKKFTLPALMQALPSDDIYVPQEIGVGMEVFYWKPSAAVIAALNSSDPNIKKAMEDSISPKVRSQLKTKGMVLLDPALLIHIKYGGVDTEVFGKSMIESTMTDLAYARSLKMLDFVTIDSLINRMLIIKIGDPNENSDYHNLAVAQARVNSFRRLLTSDIGPNMMIVWAGHDIDKLDIGAHDALLDTTQRHELARDGTKLSLGVPDSMLIGSVEGGGRGVGWAGFIALSAVAEELTEEWAQVITQLGRRIAQENGYEDVDLVFEFNRALLADREANAKVMIQAYDRGMISRQTLLEEIDKDYLSEKERKQQEEEAGDDKLFVPPPQPLGGPGGNQGTKPASQPGRPVKKGNPSKIGPERAITDKPPAGA